MLLIWKSRLFKHFDTAVADGLYSGRNMKNKGNSSLGAFHLPIGVALVVFIAIAVFFLWSEHKAHIMGAVPYVFVLLCVVMHFLMHRGHGKGHHGGGDKT
jgi:hypothetical protein